MSSRLVPGVRSGVRYYLRKRGGGATEKLIQRHPVLHPAAP